MLKRLLPAAAVLLALGLYAGAPSAQAVRQVVRVAPDVYTMTGAGSNASFVVTDDGVLVFDSDIRNNDLPFIRKVTDRKIAYVFASHASGDHSTGAWFFREDKPVYIGTRDQIRAYYQHELKEFEERKVQKAPGYNTPGAQLFPPSIGFDDNLTVLFGGLTFQAKAEGYGHTSGDMTMYIPQRRVMLMGDLLNNEIHPGQAEAAGVFYADIQGTIDILNRIIERHLPVDTYVPGHGPVHVGKGIADVVDQRDYFIVMRDEVGKMVMAGRSLEQIQKEFTVPARFAHYPPGRLAGILRVIYYQLIEHGR
ncbi:MAG: MBL fold metallo-hydrolase [Acidobacteria bacterium]|nr:MBL fold metallo-hydrolase [Acidobacteriota bacterium]